MVGGARRPAPAAHRSFLTRIREASRDLGRALLLGSKCVQLGLFPLAGSIPWLPYRRVPLPIRIRRLLEEMGLSYLKLGQFMAMRYDIIPPHICRELERLFDEVPPMSPEEARALIEIELGAPIDSVFSEFDSLPIAAASVAQVHRARTAQGELVAVKIQRPNLMPTLLSDIRNMKRIARLMDGLGLLGRLSTRGLVREFARWTLAELDFTIEGHTADEVRSKALPFEVVPAVFWELTTEKILTMEFIEGITVSRAAKLMAEGGVEKLRQHLPNFRLETALPRLATACFSQLFHRFFFQGDPHPGNVIFCDDNTIGFVDFGIFGSLTEDEQAVVVGQLESMAVGDFERSLRFYSKQLVATELTDLREFNSQVLASLRHWYEIAADPSVSMEERHLSRLIGEMIDLSRRNGLRFGVNYLLFWRALNAVNATIWMIDPHFDMVDHLRSFFAESGPTPAERLAAVGRDPHWQASVVELMSESPARLASALGRAADGDEAWRVATWEAPERARRADRESRYLAFGLTGLSALALLIGAPMAGAARLTALGLAALLGVGMLWRRM